MRSVARKDNQPLEVITVDWSHGKYRVLADEMGHEHARLQGTKLADAIVAYHAKNPGRPIYLVGHSAGSMVAMAALESLPEPLVERTILLSPSLSAEFDVRRGLRNVKQTMHVFYSPYDYFYLGIATSIFGSPDRRWTAIAGRTGFRVDPDDRELQAKIIQRSWQPADCALGNNGGHFGNYQTDFLRAHIIPLFDSTQFSPQSTQRTQR